ncbi:FecR domain-containing protein [Leptothoe kymatousa TAU-MAC 1615]|uniref:FecR domain-containing protein n=1 Tax=Leptothoe kymatousa TAU-MAC 1615 TaxID=2364775 RepID=A0ABS5Y6K3_9CYAN|nr:FecR domain-containing protein [Leptothoe kymatousa TAU-MAC 1615]
MGDALRTSASSRAELRFNDGSLARIGSHATFRFTPNTRNFQLSNGTVLMLVPPGHGRSTIQTPNAVTGIQGSALFVRFIPETNTTIIGALTDNPGGPMMAYNQDGSQQQPLSSGQLVVVNNNSVRPPVEFDLRTFYETSGLAEGLNLNNPNGSIESDDLDAVRQEIKDAIEKQAPLSDRATSSATFSVPASSSGSNDFSEEQTDSFANSETAFKNSPAATFLGEVPAPTQLSETTSPNDGGTNVPLPSIDEIPQTADIESSISSDLGLPNNGAAASTSPPLNGTPPGLGGNVPPGQGGTPPGLGGNVPPGQGGTPPGQGGTPPGLGGNVPPGQGGTPPGLGGNVPPGQGGTPPGLGGNVPPGQGGTPPGQGGTPPGQIN